MKIRILMSLFIFCLLTSYSYPVEKMTLNKCISVALTKNPIIKSYKQQYKAYLAKTSQARAFPQPEISLDYDLQPKLFSRSDESYIGISQLIEFPGRQLLRGKVASKESEEFYCEVNSARLELVYEVKKAFFQLMLVQENVKYAEENEKHAGDFLYKAREKYNHGDVSKLEVLRARVEAARAKNAKKVAQNRVILAKARLNFVLARDKYEPIEIQGSLRTPQKPLPLKMMVETALINRPEIKRKKLAIDREKLNKTLAYFNYLPDFSLGIARHKIVNEPTTWDVSLSFSVPLFFWQVKKGEVAEAKANLNSARHELKHAELSISLEVENAYHNAGSFRDQIVFFENEVLKEAQEAHQMSIISYNAGKIGSIELIESRRTLIEIKRDYSEALLNYQLALAELEKFIGSSVTNQGENK